MGRSIEKLKALTVDRLARKPGMYCDGGGLWLRVSSPTARSWAFRYMLNRTPHEMGLGKYPEITLAEARELAAAGRRLKAQGKDPLAEREAIRAALRADAAKAVSFKDAAQRYLEAHRAGWRNAKHAAQWETTLATYAEPIIGALGVHAIDTAMIIKVLEQDVRKGSDKTVRPLWTTKPETASRLRGRIEVILDWAKVRGYREGENPARWRGHLDKLLPAPGKIKKIKHHAALPFDGLSAFMAALRSENGTAARALEFMVLTAARTGEVIGARWSEIDMSKKVWTVPAERMKAGREHRVPLPARAIAILTGLKPARGSVGEDTAGFIFTSAGLRKPLSNMAMLMTLRRMKRGDLTAHGFRSTFRDWAAERTSFPSEVAEMALAHTVGDKVEAAYRRGDLFEKRHKLMEQWGSVCTKPPVSGNVVSIKKVAPR